MSEHFVPIMFLGLLLFLLSGIPVALALIGTGLLFGGIGITLGLFEPSIFYAMALRVYGILGNETLLAIPFFTLMGVILERSGMAEDLLETVGMVFGPVKGGLAFAVILVGALLAATTGVIAAAVISMGLISLPVMLRYGYNRNISTGVILASGSLAQVIPPSIVLIVLADQLGRSVGEMYSAALTPSLVLVGVYLLFILIIGLVKPKWCPALPKETLEELNLKSQYLSLFLLLAISLAAGLMIPLLPAGLEHIGISLNLPEKKDDLALLILVVIGGLIFGAALINKNLKMSLLSPLAERVAFALVPPLVLIFLVLGTIFLGLATPTEGGAMGACGAAIMSIANKRLTRKNFTEALESTTKLTCFVIFILIGSTIFSFTFNAADGHIWVESLFQSLPGGQLGFLMVIVFLVFILGMFVDFFEIAFIVIPILAPVAQSFGIDLIWFGIIIALTLQTSFLTPPFGFALFFLRSVAPSEDYKDAKTGKMIEKITTLDIYRGAVPFIIVQLLMVGIVIAFPELSIKSTAPVAEISNEEFLQLLGE